MLKFIPGILILQAITIALVLIAPADPANWGWLRLAVPVLIAGLLTAFWFGSISVQLRKDEINRLKENHAKERESLRVNAERAKTRLVKKTQRQTLQETRRAARQANIKIGLACAGVAGVGGLLILTQFASLGLLMLTAAGGALGGYMLRVRQEKSKLSLPDRDRNIPPIINAKPGNAKQLPSGRSTERDQ
jgi:hypothetical protein